MQPSKLHSCLIVMSMFLLILSSYFLLQFSKNLSVFKLILVNSSSTCFNPHDGSEELKPVSPPSHHVPELPKGRQELACQISDSGNRLNASEQDRTMACDPNQALLRVYMYDLPPKFHFGLLGWRGSMNQIWPNVSNPSQIPRYPGGLNLQHSIEYWLTLDLLSSNAPNVMRACTAIRVQNPNQADIIFVPFFSSLSYNRYSKLQGKEKISVNRMLQVKLVEFLKGRNEWKRLSGKNHLIVAHHPNSMLVARRKLGSAMFVLADFGRYPVEIANLEKDVIAPYRHMVKTIPANNSATFEERPILVYFQGAIYRKDGGAIRQELYYLLKDEKDVHFAFGSIKANGGVNGAGQGMASAKFCFNIAGDTPSSNRLFDAIASQCVPVIISDEIELPFEDVLDYSEFCIFIRASDAVKKGYILNLLRGIEQNRWTKMSTRLKEIAHHFEYQYPSRPGDAVDMIWKAVLRKISSVPFQGHRKNRYRRSQLTVTNH
ncbi:unnamed protein product [Ilex paraguariensis]|uniref:Exostosin GT47 domain-containing protein n=1 Tax=Ilex paraguariensis TaxID=185542 RepID=A0ABC8QZC3_9AQUA